MKIILNRKTTGTDAGVFVANEKTKQYRREKTVVFRKATVSYFICKARLRCRFGQANEKGQSTMLSALPHYKDGMTCRHYEAG